MVNKKGDTVVIETFVFIVFNLIFFFGMLVFVYTSGDQSFIYEQSYAKQIALLIDNAKPDTIVMVNVKDIKEFAEKNNKNLAEVFAIDNSINQVKVGLKKTGGYSYQYFSNYDVELKVNEDWLSIIIKNRIKS